jgi:hypothetical protein
MSLPCEAQATSYDAGGGAVSGPFDFNLRYDHPLSSSFGGVYTTAVGTDFSADHTIHWNGSDWIYTDPNGDQWVGDFNADNPSGDYVDTSSGSSSSALTITVTASGSSCSSSSSGSSSSGSSSSGSSSSGSAKSSSSVSESDSQP